MSEFFFSEYENDMLMNLYPYEKEFIISLFSILGVVIGSIMTFMFGFINKKSETKLKVIEKFIDKKLEAFEKLNFFINDLRSVDKYDITPENEMRRYPIAFKSKENLTQLHSNFFTILSYSIWYSTGLIREINFLQDYFVNLLDKIQNIPDENLKTVGMILWADFISLASNLDKMNKEFFVEDISNLKYKPSRKWHKYKPTETEWRLKSMKLMKEEEQLQALKVLAEEIKILEGNDV